MMYQAHRAQKLRLALTRAGCTRLMRLVFSSDGGFLLQRAVWDSQLPEGRGKSNCVSVKALACGEPPEGRPKPSPDSPNQPERPVRPVTSEIQVRFVGKSWRRECLSARLARRARNGVTLSPLDGFRRA